MTNYMVTSLNHLSRLREGGTMLGLGLVAEMKLVARQTQRDGETLIARLGILFTELIIQGKCSFCSLSI